MQIVPALNIHNGKPCVYIAGKIEDIQYIDKDPYDLIQEIGNYHIQRIHLTDVDAYVPDGKPNTGLLGSLANTCVVDLEVGGGIHNMDYVKSLQYAGVDYFVLGSVVYDNFDFLNEIAAADHVKNERILISLDVLDGQLFFHGWSQPVTGITPKELMWKCMNAGFYRFIVTDVERTSKGPNFDFYRELLEQFSGATLGAAGKINTFEDIEKLEEIGVNEVLVGNRIYKEEGLLDVVSEFNKARRKD